MVRKRLEKALLDVKKGRFLPKKSAFSTPKSVRFCESRQTPSFIFNDILASIVTF